MLKIADCKAGTLVSKTYSSANSMSQHSNPSYIAWQKSG